MKSLILTVLLVGTAGAYDSIRFLDPIKTAEMTRPVAAAADDQRLFILDGKKNALFIYDSAGKLLKSVGARGSGSGQFDEPTGVAVMGDRVYVADSGNNRVQILGLDGSFISSFGVKGSDPGELKDPQSVAAGADGRVYVADTGNDRVQVFTAEGILLFQFGGSGKLPGQFKGPTRIAVDPSDDVYVLNEGNDRIDKFDPATVYSSSFSISGADFAVDPYGFLYVLDGDHGKVVEVAPDGAIQGRFGSKGSGAGQYKKPRGVALTPDGTLLVLDTGNDRIDPALLTNKLKTALLPPNASAKLLVSGPSRDWAFSAGPIATLKSELYAYLPKEGRFAVIGEDGQARTRFGKRGKGQDATRQAGGIAASAKLGVYVSDSQLDRLQGFSLDGQWKANLAESTGFFDGKGKEGRVKRPRGVALAEMGTIYAADPGNRRVDAFSDQGVFLFAIGPKVGSLELREPVALAWDERGHFLYILDRGLKKIIKCEPSGAFLAAWGGEGSKPGQFQSPDDLAFDGRNYLFVLDGELKRVSVYSTLDGRWMTDLLSGGPGPTTLLQPASIAVQGRRLVVSDPGRQRIVSFDLHPSLAAPVSISTTSKEGIVSLSWAEVPDSWTAGYRVYRSTQRFSGYAEVGKTKDAAFEDSNAVAYGHFFYRLATEAKTKDVGAPGAPVEVTVAGAFNRAPVEISTVAIGDLFSANYKWYLRNSAGKAVVTNNVNVPFQKVKITFRLKDYMDFGYDTEIAKLEPGQSVEVPLIATLNNKILAVTEDTPVQAEFSLTYFENGKPQEVSLTKPLRLYSRNAITWQDPARVANFITPNDTPVMDFQRAVLHDAPRTSQADALNDNVVTAMHLWDAVSEAGVNYFANPTKPFESVSTDPNFPVDYTQFPRETLKRKSGQCDDLTTLLASMLDANNVRTAIVDYPGHMALMFDTGAGEVEGAALPEDELVLYEGTYWVPVEPTLVGQSFDEAIHKAAYAYKAESGKGRVKIVEVRKAWETFEPATMPESEWRPDSPPQDAVAKRFKAESAELFKDAYGFLKKRYQAEESAPGALLRLGLLEYQAGRKKEAAEAFKKAAAADPSDAAALDDLGNLSFLAGDYAAAEKEYLKASQADAQDADVWLNLVKTAVKQKDKAKARQYGAKAAAADPDYQPVVATLTEEL